MGKIGNGVDIIEELKEFGMRERDNEVERVMKKQETGNKCPQTPNRPPKQEMNWNNGEVDPNLPLNQSQPRSYLVRSIRTERWRNN